jgi:hypothetical protein
MVVSSGLLVEIIGAEHIPVIQHRLSSIVNGSFDIGLVVPGWSTL